ncbi:hypothetical protein TTRE_0000072301 [Trichuris trichiura]|uniref:Uncharacterized protein n=1 Tax=Trichuris trichiura TaxID=36087 RepID=A0A077YWP0_TRITR|nr:hypothetical protein TTRE_0000072301 [Trichuris trichiura]
MYLCYPISFPLGYILDVIIGKDVGHLYRRQELKELISRHGPRRDHFQSLFEKEEGKLTEPTQFSGQLSSMEVQVIRGILGLSKKTASDALVPLNKVFMVDYQDEIDKEFVLKVIGITSQQDVLKAMFTDEEPPQPKAYRRDRSSADRSKMNNDMPHDLSNIETFEQS